MIWVLLIAIAVVVAAGTVALATGRLAVDPVPPPASTTPQVGLGEVFRAGDVDEVRFDTALRGYRMDQVDDVLDQLRGRIAELEGEGGGAPPPSPAALSSPDAFATPDTERAR
ncbi:hypothetical protein GCM10022199_13030 [Marihabitans asiaticum]|uniref:DivIVA domain-containing protein n=1 Tax=Marihabitans asiaticum TaxID=415218 RepID=A0A560WIT6_9MICO|nr:DivIVA domain-containing protein [Marihabitans asiaticum]TWD17315.1 DivIVA domain-containing protein [Marihabitans asiaticum]